MERSHDDALLLADASVRGAAGAARGARRRGRRAGAARRTTFEDGDALYDVVCERGLEAWSRSASATRTGTGSRRGWRRKPRRSTRGV